MDDLLRDFLTESAENLAKLDNDIVQLERCPKDAARLNVVFRTIHTIDADIISSKFEVCGIS